MNICRWICVFALVSINLLNSGCLYYYPDLKNESRGSVLGGLATGLAVAEATTDIIVWGAGTILGSVFGGMIGQDIDNVSPLRLDDPPNDPIPLFYYQTIRAPFRTQQFHPAKICFDDKRLRS